MATILKREFAPVSEQAWKMLDASAEQVLKSTLSGRKVVDFDGPHGWELGAVNVGRLQLGSQKTQNGIGWGIRQVQPVVEVRIPFTLKQMELDNISRGCDDADVDALLAAATKGAQFEDRAIFEGFKEGQIVGILPASSHKAIKLPGEAEDYPVAVASAVKAMAAAGVGGPYHLVLGPEAYFKLVQCSRPGQRPVQVIRELTGADVVLSSVLEGGLVLSGRGGDLALTVGKDFAIGYASHDRETVELFLTESFTFRVLEPAAVVALTAGGRSGPKG